MQPGLDPITPDEILPGIGKMKTNQIADRTYTYYKDGRQTDIYAAISNLNNEYDASNK